MEKSQIIALIIIIITTIFSISNLTIAGVSFHSVNVRWTEQGYSAYSALILSCSILSFITIFISIISYYPNPKKNILNFLQIPLTILSSLFLLSISIFSFIASRTRYFEDYLGCNSEYKGILHVYNSIDLYLQIVDKYLCSEKCPCSFNETTARMYTSNSSTSAYYNIWSKSIYQFYPPYIDNCGEDNLKSIYDEYISKNAYYDHTFNQKKFHKFYKRFEQKFKCTGFCGLHYYNDFTKTNQKIVKYLFSGLNNGIPEHFGCLHAMLDWVRKMILWFGINAMVLFVGQFILFFLGIYFSCFYSKANINRDSENVIDN